MRVGLLETIWSFIGTSNTMCGVVDWPARHRQVRDIILDCQSLLLNIVKKCIVYFIPSGNIMIDRSIQRSHVRSIVTYCRVSDLGERRDWVPNSLELEDGNGAVVAIVLVGALCQLYGARIVLGRELHLEPFFEVTFEVGHSEISVHISPEASEVRGRAATTRAAARGLRTFQAREVERDLARNIGETIWLVLSDDLHRWGTSAGERRPPGGGGVRG